MSRISPAKISAAFRHKSLVTPSMCAQRVIEQQKLLRTEKLMAGLGTSSSCARREFIRAAARYTLLTAITVGAAVFGLRRTDASCQKNFVCGSCPKFTGCQLPPAREKHAQRKEEL